MTTIPRFLLITAHLAALSVIVALIVLPVPAGVWRRLDPVGHGMWCVSHTSWFTAPFRNDIAEVEDPVESWRAVVRAPEADSLLRILANGPNPAARLYALAGLTLRDSATAARLRAELLLDTTAVIANLHCRESSATLRVTDVARVVGTPAFASMLLHGNAECP